MMVDTVRPISVPFHLRGSLVNHLLKEVMHVPGLKKNLISVAMLEDKGYDVVFSEGKAFLHSKETSETRRIGVRVKNLYQLQVDSRQGKRSGEPG